MVSESYLTAKESRNLTADILLILGQGETQAKKLKQIRQELGYGSERKIRLAITELRLQKYLVLSSTHGYWIAENFAEYEKWSEYITSYIADLSHIRKSVEDGALEKYKKAFQIPMFMG